MNLVVRMHSQFQLQASESETCQRVTTLRCDRFSCYWIDSWTEQHQEELVKFCHVATDLIHFLTRGIGWTLRQVPLSGDQQA